MNFNFLNDLCVFTSGVTDSPAEPAMQGGPGYFRNQGDPLAFFLTLSVGPGGGGGGASIFVRPLDFTHSFILLLEKTFKHKLCVNNV